jgi:uncharacterized protein involved in exopolysaccharide biosynthesis
MKKPTYSHRAQVAVFGAIVGSILGIALLLFWLAKDIQ